MIAALWSAEVLHAMRLHSDSFRAVCPEDPAAFQAWWSCTRAKGAGKSSSLVVFDPAASPRQRQFVGLEDALERTTRAGYRGYADAAGVLAARRAA